MADDNDILKVLQSIEKLVKGSMAAAGNKLPNSAQQSEAIKRAKADKDGNRSFTATSANTKATNETLLGLNRNLIRLDTQVGRTSSGFGSLTAKMAQFQASLQPATASAGPTVLASSIVQVDPLQWTGLIHAVTAVGADIVKAVLGSTIPAAANVAASGVVPPASSTGTVITPVTALKPVLPPVTTPVPVPVSPNSTSVLGAMVQRFIGLGISAEVLGVVFNNVIEAGKRLAVDFLTLSRIGLGSGDSLQALYLNAVSAGMSLKEYTSLIEKNITVAARQGDFKQFDALISAADSQLAAMGIFGSEARGLQASLAESSTVMGIAQGDLKGQVASQIDMYASLRKATGMTTDGFAGMIHSLSQNEEVQRELIGLAPKQRKARLDELVQIQTTGNRLGLTADAAKALGDAMIAQRNATVQERLDSAGSLGQAMNFVGMGDQAPRGMELTRIKRRTPEQDDELRQLVSETSTRLQANGDSTDLSVQAVSEEMSKNLDKGFGALIKADRTAKSAGESGAVVPKFDASISEFGQWVGKLTAWARGLQESIASPVIAAIGGALLATFQAPLISMVKRAFSFGGATGATAATGAEGAGLLSALNPSVAGAAISTFVTDLAQSFKIIQSFAGGGAMGTTVAIVDSIGTIGMGIARAVGGFFTAFAPIGGALAALFELVNGDITSALNPSGGFFNRIGGVVTAFFSAIPNFIMDTAEFIFGPSEFMTTMRNGFGQVTALANYAVKSLVGLLLDGITAPLKMLLPKESGLVKMLDGWSTSLHNSADENFKAFDTLASNSSQNLSTLSKSNKTVTATTAATNKQTDAQLQFNSAASNQPTAASLIGDAATFAMPQVQVPPSIAPPAAVNTVTPAPSSLISAPISANGTEMMTVLTAMLQVLRDGVAIDTRHADSTEALLKAVRPSAVFADGEQTVQRLIRRA